MTDFIKTVSLVSLFGNNMFDPLYGPNINYNMFDLCIHFQIILFISSFQKSV